MTQDKKTKKTRSAKFRRDQSKACQKRWVEGGYDSLRGKINRGRALTWKLQDPNGKTHLIESLEHWCRKNESLFLPDLNPGSKNALWLRAARGIAESHTKEGRSNWRGWQVISKFHARS